MHLTYEYVFTKIPPPPLLTGSNKFNMLLKKSHSNFYTSSYVFQPSNIFGKVSVITCIFYLFILFS